MLSPIVFAAGRESMWWLQPRNANIYAGISLAISIKCNSSAVLSMCVLMHGAMGRVITTTLVYDG